MENGSLTQKRLEYVDAARGIGIILLVLGHIITICSPLFNWIFSFHMPLFFFLSGMTVSEQHLNHFPAFLVKKLKVRVCGYLLITALGFSLCMIIPQYRADMITQVGYQRQLMYVFYRGRPQWLYIGQVWFLLALFWSELYFYGWYHLISKRSGLLQLGFFVLLLVLSCNMKTLGSCLPYGHVPLLMDVACMGTVCYILGFLTKRHNLIGQLNTGTKLMLIPVCFAVNFYFGTYRNGYVNMVDLIFSNMLQYVIAMLSGIGGVLLLSFFWQKSKILNWLGRHSLPLFASHTFVTYLVREIVFWCTGTHYTMMENVPNALAFLMTMIILVLMIPVGLLHAFLEQQVKMFSGRFSIYKIDKKIRKSW